MEKQLLKFALFIPFLIGNEGLIAKEYVTISYENQLCDMGCKCPTDGQSITFLDCSGRGFANLPPALIFEESLNIASFQSNHISFLNQSNFYKADNLEMLDLSLNQIMDIEDSTFVPFKNLTQLKLSHNHLSQVTEGLLHGLSTLRVLELGHNALLHFPSTVFKATPNLQELRVQFNPLFDLSEDSFKYLTKLEKLDLEDTGLVALASEVFIPTPNLRWLSLSANAFEIVPRSALEKAKKLEILDLSGNDFSNFASGDFADLPSLVVLYLNSLPLLERVESHAFKGLTGLNTLSLSYNPNLDFLDMTAFGHTNSSSFPSRQLYLRKNALRTLKSPVDSEKWAHINFVDLADNPWMCDCNLQWMKNLRLETQMNIACDTPSNLHGRPYGTLHPSELKCQNTWTLAVNIAMAAFAVALGIVALAATAVVCGRTPTGLYVRAKKQFSYSKVQHPNKQECVDLEWDPSADI